MSADDAEALHLELEDTGIGIASRDMARLFGEFDSSMPAPASSSARSISASPSLSQGTGLGLALTRKLVEARGGRVGATSELGKGSCFFAVLPGLLELGS